MSEKHIRGRAGEEYVCEYLIKHGWKILARNFRIRGGEIDIVAGKGDIVAFTEVKTRKFGSLTEGIEAVDSRKRSLIVRTADKFISERCSGNCTVRFDVAVVTVTTENIPRVLEMKYLEDAFDAFMV